MLVLSFTSSNSVNFSVSDLKDGVIAHVSWHGLHLLPKWRPTRAHKKSRTQFWLSETSGIIYHLWFSVHQHKHKQRFKHYSNTTTAIIPAATYQ